MTAAMNLCCRSACRVSSACASVSAAYQAERDDLAQERTKLLQAHYAGDIKYDRAKALIDDCLALAGDCHALYMSINDSLRRTANQAFFDKLYVTTDDQIDGQPGEPFNTLFNPDVQRLALHPLAEDESRTQTSSVAGLNDERGVEVAGIEPASSRDEPGLLRAQPTRRSAWPPPSRRHVVDRPSSQKVPH